MSDAGDERKIAADPAETSAQPGAKAHPPKQRYKDSHPSAVFLAPAEPQQAHRRQAEKRPSTALLDAAEAEIAAAIDPDSNAVQPSALQEPGPKRASRDAERKHPRQVCLPSNDSLQATAQVDLPAGWTRPTPGGVGDPGARCSLPFFLPDILALFLRHRCAPCCGT